MKIVKAVAPYDFDGGINFKKKTFDAWVKAGGKVAKCHYPPRWAHFIAHRFEIPILWKNKKEARLRFVQPVTFRFDTFPDYAEYEIIPLLWDTWEPYHEIIAEFFIRFQVRTAIFCASQTADVMRKRFPQMNILTITEGVDTSLYFEGKPLKDRNIDLLEYGRPNKKVFYSRLPSEYNHIRSQEGKKIFITNKEFSMGLSDTKITIAFPKHDTCPEETGFVETLTQRYWENMLSRVVMVGRAPHELTELIGYNPVIDAEVDNPSGQIVDILNNIDHYQDMVDKNRETALNFADWSIRMKIIRQTLMKSGYVV